MGDSGRRGGGCKFGLYMKRPKLRMLSFTGLQSSVKFLTMRKSSVPLCISKRLVAGLPAAVIAASEFRNENHNFIILSVIQRTTNEFWPEKQTC